jgi:hypothetical protein
MLEAAPVLSEANIKAVEVLDLPIERDLAVDLRTFASCSFGTFWNGGQVEVEWRFTPSATPLLRAP